MFTFYHYEKMPEKMKAKYLLWLTVSENSFQLSGSIPIDLMTGSIGTVELLLLMTAEKERE